MNFERIDGVLGLDQYAAIGDGRSVALVGLDGSVDWWCVPNIDSPPLFDQILRDANPKAGRFTLAPSDPDFSASRRYLPDSNVLETTFTTASGEARVVESLNSWLAGRLPWSELARRVEGVSGRVEFVARMIPGTRFDADQPERFESPNGTAIKVGDLIAAIRHDDRWSPSAWDGPCWSGTCVVEAGDRAVVAIVVAQAEPLVIPKVQEIDDRIDLSDRAWREWARKGIVQEGPYAGSIRRSALALKLLIYSPTGSIAAAATMGLPERIGGPKNWDYRLTWIRDVCYTINAFLRIGAQSEAKAAFAWILRTIRNNGPGFQVVYTLQGQLAFKPVKVGWEGYRGSTPIFLSNQARSQLQLGIHGDLMETARLFAGKGHILDPSTRDLLADLADHCVRNWRKKDAGLWELETYRHYTVSKVECWIALDNAAKLAEEGHLPSKHLDRWKRERDKISAYIERYCWSDARQSYTEYTGGDSLDAAILVTVRFGFAPKERLESTIAAVRRELARGPLMYRYSGAEEEEGAFLACSFWLVEALIHVGQLEDARRTMDEVLALVEPRNLGLLNEMVDPATGSLLGNLPQGLSHLALINAALALTEAEKRAVPG